MESHESLVMTVFVDRSSTPEVRSSGTRCLNALSSCNPIYTTFPQQRQSSRDNSSEIYYRLATLKGKGRLKPEVKQGELRQR